MSQTKDKTTLTRCRSLFPLLWKSPFSFSTACPTNEQAYRLRKLSGQRIFNHPLTICVDEVNMTSESLAFLVRTQSRGYTVWLVGSARQISHREYKVNGQVGTDWWYPLMLVLTGILIPVLLGGLTAAQVIVVTIMFSLILIIWFTARSRKKILTQLVAETLQTT